MKKKNIKPISTPKTDMVICPVCNGSKISLSANKCLCCNGTGKITEQTAKVKAMIRHDLTEMLLGLSFIARNNI